MAESIIKPYFPYKIKSPAFGEAGLQMSQFHLHYCWMPSIAMVLMSLIFEAEG
jgi:hypothetical protein